MCDISAVGFLDLLENLKTQSQKSLFLYKSNFHWQSNAFLWFDLQLVLLIKEKTHSSNLHLLYEKRNTIFSYYVVDRDVDILAVTETWLKADACCDNITRDVTPTGYTFVHSPRLNGIIGGVGMLYRTNLKVQLLN